MKQTILHSCISLVLLVPVMVWAQSAFDSSTDLSRLNSDDKKTRLNGVIAISNAPITSADVLIRLWEIGESDADANVRTQALNVRLGIQNAARQVPEQVSRGLIAAAEGGDTSRRRIAVVLLPKFGGVHAGATLDKLAATDEPSLRVAVFQSRYLIRREPERPAFALEGLRSPHNDVIDAAAAYIGPESRNDYYLPLLRQLESDNSAGIWASLILARWGQKIDRPTETLMKLVGSERQWVRKAAAFGLTRSGDASLKVAIASLSSPSIDIRLDLALALFARFDAQLEAPARAGNFKLEQEIFRAKNVAGAIAGLKKHGLQVAGLRGHFFDWLACERSNPANKPTADAAVVALGDLFTLAAADEAKQLAK